MTYDELLQKHQMREAYIAKQDDIISNIRKQLEASQKLSEERRVALEKCSPMTNIAKGCYWCGTFFHSEHEPICDYVRLIKQD